jgi:threonine dehydratase
VSASRTLDGRVGVGAPPRSSFLDAPATIVTPRKLTATRGYGAEVITYNRYREDSEQIAAGIAWRRSP